MAGRGSTGKGRGNGPRKHQGQDPRVTQALALAADAVNRGDFSRAQQLLQQLAAFVPGHPDVLHLGGCMRLAQGEPAEAVRLIKQAIRVAPKVPFYHYNLGNAYFLARDYVAARDAFKKATRLDPEFTEAVENLAITQRELKHLAEAEALFERTTQLKPKDPEAWLNLAKIRMQLHKPAGVEEAIGAAIANTRNQPSAAFWLDVGKIYIGLSRYQDAEKAIRAADQCSPNDAEVLFTLGSLLGELGRTAEAEQALQQALGAGCAETRVKLALARVHVTSGDAQRGRTQALELAEQAHGDAELLLAVAEVLSLLGDFERQEAVLSQVLELRPEDTRALVQLAGLPHSQVTADQLRHMERRIDDPGVEVGVRSALGFVLGDHYRRAQKHDQAFRFYKKGNLLKGARWDREAYRRWVDDTCTIYTTEFFEQRRGWRNTSSLPLLIVGMPRSGTTLFEQILSSHSLIQAGGEFGTVEGLGSGAQVVAPPVGERAESILALDEASVCVLQQNYLAKVDAQRSGQQRFVTNKLPHNFQQLGLFALMFPEAPIFHVRRDPRDTLLSIYFQNFAGYHPYAYDLQDLAFQYCEQERLMDHWKAVLPNPVLTIQYEDLVGDLWAQILRSCAFLDIEPEEDMRQFHQRENEVKTASKWQVRQPLYASSVGRWKPYEQFLQPLFIALQRFAAKSQQNIE